MGKGPSGHVGRPDPERGAEQAAAWDGAIAVNRQWADFLRGLSSLAYAEPDPLLTQAMKFHPRFHMYLPDEDDRLTLLQAECLRLCAGNESRAKRLAADVIWGYPS